MAVDEFLTVAEIAAILKLNQQTVRNWIDRGELPAVHVGRRVRIKRSDFDQLIEAGYRGSTSRLESASGIGIWDGDVPMPDKP
jgi:excisionase family DNA binding protein